MTQNPFDKLGGARIRFCKPIFIYQKAENPNPSTSEKPQGKEKKETQEKATTPLSEKERQEVLKNYAATKKRLDEAREKLWQCLSIIQKLPKGEHQERAQKLYDQASKILDGSFKDFPKEIDFKDPESIKTTITALHGQNKKLLLETLQKNSIDASKVIDNIYLLETDATKILEKIKTITAFGLNVNQALELIGNWKTKDNWKGLINFLTYSRKNGIDNDDTVGLWNKTMYSYEELTQKINELRKSNITKNFFQVISISHSFDNNYAKIAEKAAEFEKLGCTNQQALEILDSGKIDIFKNFLELKISLEDAKSIIDNSNLNYRPEKAREIIKEMKNAGITSHFSEIYNIGLLAEIENQSPNYQKISALLPLKDFGFRPKDINEFCKLPGDTQNLFNYIKILRTNGYSQESIKKSYKMETDPNKVTEYLNLLDQIGFGVLMFPTLYPVIPDIEEFKSIMPMAREFEKNGLDQVHALYFAKMLTEQGNSSLIEPEFFAKAIEFINKYKDPKDPTSISLATILWKLSNGDIKAAEYIINQASAEETIKLLSAPPEIALPYIDAFRKDGITTDDIISTWQYSQDPAEGIRVYKFRKEFTDIFNKLTGTTSGLTESEKKPIASINLYYQQNPQTQLFLIHMLRNEKTVPFENFKGFLDDETLPLCVEVFQHLDSANDYIETAMRFGRSLFYQGFKTVPEQTIFDQKFKEFQELQNSSDKIKLFEGRNVIFAANGEIREDSDELRFNDDETHQKLTQSIGPKGTVSFDAPSSDKPTIEELQKVKQSIIYKLATTPPPMTFYFNGHGGPDKLYLNNGKVVGNKPQGEDVDGISYKEVALALYQRTKNFPDKIAQLSKDILISSSCYNHNFIRNVYKELSTLGGVPPIAIGESEYNQFAYSADEKKDEIYGLGKMGTTLGNVRKAERTYEWSNITVYVPNQAGQPQQVVKNEPQNSDKPAKKAS